MNTYVIPKKDKKVRMIIFMKITKIIISRQVFLIFKIILIHYLDMNTHQRITRNMIMNHLRMNQ